MKYKRYPRFSLRNQRDNAIKLRFFGILEYHSNKSRVSKDDESFKK